jgi:hypothetical protein
MSTWCQKSMTWQITMITGSKKEDASGAKLVMTRLMGLLPEKSHRQSYARAVASA